VFDEVFIVDVHGAGNKLVLGFTWPSGLDHEKAVQRATGLSTRLRLRYDLGDIVEDGFREPGDDGKNGRVLLDKDRGSDDG